jgi:hypothetical protein
MVKSFNAKRLGIDLLGIEYKLYPEMGVGVEGAGLYVEYITCNFILRK